MAGGSHFKSSNSRLTTWLHQDRTRGAGGLGRPDALAKLPSPPFQWLQPSREI